MVEDPARIDAPVKRPDAPRSPRAERAARSSAPRRRGRGPVLLTQIALIALVLALWQWLPQIPALSKAAPVFNDYFVSSPARVAKEIWSLAIGSPDTGSIWPYLGATLAAALIGTITGAAGGLLLALWLSTNDFASRTATPFIAVMNATPRVAIIPIVVIIVGPNPAASAITAVTIVFFIVFFNAFEGSRSIPRETLQNARLLGSRGVSSVWRVRVPYAAAWTFASLPNAISFGLVGAVTAEILSGAQGVGKLMMTATNTVNADLTFAVVAYVGALGVILVLLTSLARKRLLSWWDTDSLAE